MNTKKISSDKVFELIFKEKATYLYYEFEDAVVRVSVNRDGKATYFVKLKGREEFKAHKESNLVAEALLSPILITKEDYYKF